MKYSLSKEQSKRINISKLLFSLLVICIHNNRSKIKFSDAVIKFNIPVWFEYLKYLISNVIPEIAVPGFFLIASLLLYKRDYDWLDNIKKKFRTLIIPYIIMNSLWIVLYAIFQRIPSLSIFFNDPDNTVSNFKLINWLHAYGIGSRFPFLYPLWFLRNLFILNIFSKQIKYVIDKLPKLTMAFLLILYLFLPDIDFIYQYYYFDIVNLFAWCTGYFIVKYQCSIDKFDNNMWVVLLYILTTIICLILKDSDYIYIKLILKRINIVIGIIFWYSFVTLRLSDNLKELLNKYSKYSFGIYIFHEMMLTFSVKLITRLFGSNLIVQIIEYIFLPFIICFIAIIICMIIRRISPTLFKLITGSRIN